MANIKREEQLMNLNEECNRIILEDLYALIPIEFVTQHKQNTIRYCRTEERKRKFIEECEKAITKESEIITSNSVAKTYAENTRVFKKERD